MIIIFGLIALITLIAAAALIISERRKNTRKKLSLPPPKDRDPLLKNAKKRLAQNPRNPAALAQLGARYFQDQDWENAYRTYKTLASLPSLPPGITPFEIKLRYALAALKQGFPDEAYHAFSAARSLQQNSFDANYNLGCLEFSKKNYDKAAQFLLQAQAAQPNHPQTLRSLGHSFFKLKRYKEALPLIRRSLDLKPQDKDSLYALAGCYDGLGQPDKALQVFTRLRADPTFGPNACLCSGAINMNQHQIDKALEDFEIGLKHPQIKPNTLLELKYRAALASLTLKKIPKALAYLKEIQAASPNYRDVPLLIERYQELSANQNLQTFLLGPSADFVALCRKIGMTYFPRAKTTIINISTDKPEWADLLAEVDTPKWSDLVLFRFTRSQLLLEEPVLRDLHSHLKKVKAGKGICFTAGNFSDKAKRYTEARPIDLIEKEQLAALLNALDRKPLPSTPQK